MGGGEDKPGAGASQKLDPLQTIETDKAAGVAWTSAPMASQCSGWVGSSICSCGIRERMLSPMQGPPFT